MEKVVFIKVVDGDGKMVQLFNNYVDCFNWIKDPTTRFMSVKNIDFLIFDELEDVFKGKRIKKQDERKWYQPRKLNRM